MTAELLQRIGLNERFGYKTGSPSEPRCFFRFIRTLDGDVKSPGDHVPGKWHDVRAKRDFGYDAPAVIEILAHEMTCSQLMIFACCCAQCAGQPENRIALKKLLAAGVSLGDVTSGYWPEHEAAENQRLEFEMSAAGSKAPAVASAMAVRKGSRLVPQSGMGLAATVVLIVFFLVGLQGGASEARVAHNHEVVGSIPTPAINSGVRQAILPKPQCNSGTIQSRPFPARTVKVRQVRGNNQTGTARPASDRVRKSTELQSRKPVSISQPSTFNPQLYFALGEIESGCNDRAIGAVGEVSRYQIRPALWRRFATPGMVPSKETDARVVVQRILLDRVRSFTARAHRPPTAAEYYILWNAPDTLKRGHQTWVVRERAERFSNLFYA